MGATIADSQKPSSWFTSHPEKKHTTIYWSRTVDFNESVAVQRSRIHLSESAARQFQSARATQRHAVESSFDELSNSRLLRIAEELPQFHSCPVYSQKVRLVV